MLQIDDKGNYSIDTETLDSFPKAKEHFTEIVGHGEIAPTKAPSLDPNDPKFRQIVEWTQKTPSGQFGRFTGLPKDIPTLNEWGISDYLRALGVKHELHYPIGKMFPEYGHPNIEFDIWIQDLAMAIEVNPAWHKGGVSEIPRVAQLDTLKEQIAKEHGISLITIDPGTTYTQFASEIDSKIAPELRTSGVDVPDLGGEGGHQEELGLGFTPEQFDKIGLLLTEEFVTLKEEEYGTRLHAPEPGSYDDKWLEHHYEMLQNAYLDKSDWHIKVISEEIREFLETKGYDQTDPTHYIPEKYIPKPTPEDWAREIHTEEDVTGCVQCKWFRSWLDKYPDTSQPNLESAYKEHMERAHGMKTEEEGMTYKRCEHCGQLIDPVEEYHTHEGKRYYGGSDPRLFEEDTWYIDQTKTCPKCGYGSMLVNKQQGTEECPKCKHSTMKIKPPEPDWRETLREEDDDKIGEIAEHPNEWRYRLVDPKTFDDFRYGKDELGSGISVIWGFTGEGDERKSDIQAIRFNKAIFKTKEEAEAWLKAHKDAVEQIKKKEGSLDDQIEYLQWQINNLDTAHESLQNDVTAHKLGYDGKHE